MKKINICIFLLVISLILVPNVVDADTVTKEEFTNILENNGYSTDEIYESSYYTYFTMKKEGDLPQFAYYNFTSSSGAKSYINELYNEVEEYDVFSQSTYNMDEATRSTNSYFTASFTNNDIDSYIIVSRIDNTIIVGLGNSTDKEEIVNVMKDLDYYVDVSNIISRIIIIIGVVFLPIIIVGVLIIIFIKKKNKSIDKNSNCDKCVQGNDYQNLNLNNFPSKLPEDNYNSNPNLISKKRDRE